MVPPPLRLSVRRLPAAAPASAAALSCSRGGLRGATAAQRCRRIAARSSGNDRRRARRLGSGLAASRRAVGDGAALRGNLGLGFLPMLGIAAMRPPLPHPDLVGPLADARFLVRLHGFSLVDRQVMAKPASG